MLITLMMRAYGHAGCRAEALNLLRAMLAEGLKFDALSLVTALNAYCTCPEALSTGELIHGWIIETGAELDTLVGTALMIMYVKCKKLDSVPEVFEQMTHRHVVAWTLLISAYSEGGCFEQAFQAFCQMQVEGLLPNSYTVVAVLQACTVAAGLKDEKMKRIAGQVVESGYMEMNTWNVIVATSLIGICGRCGNVEQALKVFGQIPADERDAVAWNAIVTVCVEQGRAAAGLELFRKMRLEGVRPTIVTFIQALSAVTETGRLQAGRMLHEETLECFMDKDVVVATALASMYHRFGRMDDSVNALVQIEQEGRDLVCWNMLISALVQHSRSTDALRYFRQMNLEGVRPDKGTFSSLLSNSSGAFSKSDVEMMVAQMSQSGFSCNLVVNNALLNMHAKRHELQDAERTFDGIPERDVVSWNTMLSAYVTEEEGEQAIKLFHRMQQEGVRPDKVTFTTIFCVFSELRDLDEACKVILSTMQELQPQLYLSLLIASCAQQGLSKQALVIFRYVQLQGLPLDNATLVPVISSCAACSALNEGKLIHAELHGRQTTVQEDCKLKNALIDLYGKCGKLEYAYNAFACIRQPNLISWTAIVAAFAHNGNAEGAVELFRRMILYGCAPDMVTFTSLLSVCSHGGMLEEGCRNFGSMSSDYFITPMSEHCSCMIDLLGRAGRLEEAEYLIHTMPCAPTLHIWTALLTACRSHGDVERAQKFADRVVMLQPGTSTGYIGLTNIMY